MDGNARLVRILAGIAALGFFVGAGVQFQGAGSEGSGVNPFALFSYAMAALTLMLFFPWPKEPGPPR